MAVRRFDAVLFDVDGTLYRQDRLRLAMAGELALASLMGLRTARIVRAYRHAHEALRNLGAADRPLADEQFRRTADSTGVDEASVRKTVQEWMSQRPLKYLPWCKRAGLDAALEGLTRVGVRCGVLSDYASAEKIEALGLSCRFDLRLCSTDEGINALKPHPRGFLAACERWDLAPAKVLYVGDRPDVDGRGAEAAGMACAIIGASTAAAAGADHRWIPIRRFDELEELCIT